MPNKVISYSLFSEYDIHLFKSGSHAKLYERFGSHPLTFEGQEGTYFAVYAPAARSVQVIGDFNQWNGVNYELYVRWDESGIWEGFIPNVMHGQLYKYRIHSHYDAKVREKADPYGLFFEVAPKTSTITWKHSYKWGDEKWTEKKEKANYYNSPMSIYELHLGSWKKRSETGLSLDYEELATELVGYVQELGFTHVEFLPVTEHPYYPSWGYLSTGFFAPTSRFGTPEQFMFLIDAFHSANIGVVLDWVPAHFPSDESWLADFDGSKVYEHPNPKKGFHPDWNSLIFNFERPEVKSFLISSACFWLDKFHIDGLRVDAVASMIYLDYSRDEGEWDPNEYGTNENLGAIKFLKDLNVACYSAHPGIMMIAEESTSFSGVTTPVHDGGLGFGFKWMMGWMNDSLRYMARDPAHRKYHHNDISFSMAYAHSESFILPLSHDEVVHGKQAIISKMPGDEWQKFASARLLYAYMFTHPGHKLLFMGCEIGQTSEWNVDQGVSWDLLNFELHRGMQLLIKNLNVLLKDEEALHYYNFEQKGFQWIDHSDHDNSVLCYLRYGLNNTILVTCNFTPTPLSRYRIGIPTKGDWSVILNSDDAIYGGSNFQKNNIFKSIELPSHGFGNSIELPLPPLSVQILKLK